MPACNCACTCARACAFLLLGPCSWRIQGNAVMVELTHPDLRSHLQEDHRQGPDPRAGGRPPPQTGGPSYLSSVSAPWLGHLTGQEHHGAKCGFHLRVSDFKSFHQPPRDGSLTASLPTSEQSVSSPRNGEMSVSKGSCED